jgi:hypothetical protein
MEPILEWGGISKSIPTANQVQGGAEHLKNL